MSEITEKALDLIETFEVRRARDIDDSILMSMTAPIVAGEEQNQIISLFNSEQYLQDDEKGYLASFVVMSPTNIPLVFFSFRCGELFKEPQVEKMKIGHDAAIAFKKLMNGSCKSEEESQQALAAVKRAIDEGLTPDDWQNLYQKKESWNKDEKLEATKEITKVLVSYPAIELKLFGTNESAKEYWKSLGLPEDMKMGGTLFWLKAVKIIEKITRYVGCQYVYLFAADKEAEGQLVQYYRVGLGFNSDSNLSANKPTFDWQCQFLYQSIDELLDRRKLFLDYVSNYKEDKENV
jgi:hypothetical protein